MTTGLNQHIEEQDATLAPHAEHTTPHTTHHTPPHTTHHTKETHCADNEHTNHTPTHQHTNHQPSVTRTTKPRTLYTVQLKSTGYGTRHTTRRKPQHKATHRATACCVLCVYVCACMCMLCCAVQCSWLPSCCCVVVALRLAALQLQTRPHDVRGEFVGLLLGTPMMTCSGSCHMQPASCDLRPAMAQCTQLQTTWPGHSDSRGWGPRRDASVQTAP